VDSDARASAAGPPSAPTSAATDSQLPPTPGVGCLGSNVYLHPLFQSPIPPAIVPRQLHRNLQRVFTPPVPIPHSPCHRSKTAAQKQAAARAASSYNVHDWARRRRGSRGKTPLTRGSGEPTSAHAPSCPLRIGADSPRPHMQCCHSPAIHAWLPAPRHRA
jgi:hypothetical protein